MTNLPERTISGWGGFPRAATRLARPEEIRGLAESIGGPGPVIARGLGRSYGDASVNPGGVAVLVERLNRFLGFDPDSGEVRCESGVTFEDLLRHFLPRGFFPPVTPGTKYVTMGGAIAADVHGKSHHKDGAFGRHVRWFTLLLPSGETVRCSREERADLFYATLGGMGLTGIVTDLALTLRPVESGYLQVDYEKAPNLDRALGLFDSTDDQYTHSVAWIDCLSRGASLGRSVLMRGNWAPASALPPAFAERPLDVPTPRRMSVPFDAPGFLLNPLSVRLFNAMFYGRHPVGRKRLVPYEPFFYPLDKLRHWNRLYGRRGFLQYQCVLPREQGREGLVRILELLSGEGHASFLAVLKRFGAADPGPLLSFPRPGYTLAVDLPRDGDRQDRLLADLDQVVLRHGGRVYLAKDARLQKESFHAMYPEAARWLEIKRRVDPERRFSSSLSRRLGLDG